MFHTVPNSHLEKNQVIFHAHVCFSLFIQKQNDCSKAKFQEMNLVNYNSHEYDSKLLPKFIVMAVIEL